jgi:RNA polymerase sigma-70 factor (ECF subfamily)
VHVDNEHDWIAAAQRGDTQAFCDLVDRYQTHVYNLAWRMLGDGPEAEDAAQESFIRACTRLDTFQPDKSFKTWLLSITAHYCIDRLRQRRLTWLSIDRDEAPEGDLVAGQPGPEESMIQSEQEQMVQQMLAGLPPDYRLPIVLRYWYDMSYEEIAEITRSSVSAIKSRLFRARGLLAERLTARAGALQRAGQEA